MFAWQLTVCQVSVSHFGLAVSSWFLHQKCIFLLLLFLHICDLCMYWLCRYWQVKFKATLEGQNHSKSLPVTLTNVCQSFLFWGRVLFNYLVLIGNEQKCYPSYFFEKRVFKNTYYHFPWTCGWNTILADEKLIGRWLPLAALTSYLYYPGRQQGQHCTVQQNLCRLSEALQTTVLCYL